MKKILIFSLLTLLVAACDYGSYAAVGCIKQNNGTSCNLSFESFEGNYTFQLKKDNKDGLIHYNVSLKEGNATIFYKWANFDKEILVQISNSEHKEDRFGYVGANQGVEITIQTDEKCFDGSFYFSLSD